jgi:polysaccharide deacetylase family protein (PEP-CTERM system associated)
MSVDVEDYFHVANLAPAAPRARWPEFASRVERNTNVLLDIFDGPGVRATFFVLGWVAERHPALVRDIAARGHEIASHGFDHQIIYEQAPAAFREDIRRSKRLLEDLAGVGVLGYRAPSFSITRRSLWALDVLVEEGYRYDASIFPVRHDRYGIPDAPRGIHRLLRPGGELVEFPPSTVRVLGVNLPVAGGGYFRIFPYWWTRLGIARVNRRERQPVAFYLHPWEVDPDQPRLTVGALSRFRHYRNLDTTADRLRTLCRTFPFASMATVLASRGFGVEAAGAAAKPGVSRRVS